MDEEDIREAEEAKTLETTDDFTGFGSTAADTSRRGGLMDVFRPSGETMGVKLLKRMGWKEGQGIGPKVRRTANLGDGVDDNTGDTYLFAPDNTAVISFTRKTDTKGLGFEGETRLDADADSTATGPSRGDDEGGPLGYGNHTSSKNSASVGKSKQKVRGGIGVGVLNDDGSDEEDPYEIGPRISYNRVIDQDKKTKKKNQDAEGQRSIRGSNPRLDSKPVFISKKKAAADKTKPGGFRKCHDGRLPLDGFLLGLQMAELNISDQAQQFAPPKIPEGWQSSKAPATTARDTSNYMSTAEAAKASSHDPKSRAAVLGEAQLPGKSVFDYMTPESRERMVKATGRTDLPPALGEKPPKGFETSEAQKKKDLRNFVPKLDKDIATQALSRGIGGWMPYAEDESKKARYRAYLELQAGFREDLPPRAPDTTDNESWASELNEFARAAEVFRPMTGMMASRFTSSSSLPQSTESAESPLLKKPESKPEDPAEAAARVGMYGPMTRLSLPFSPARVLCKRFNVRPPDNSQVDKGDAGGGPSESQAASASKLELVSMDTMAKLMMQAGPSGQSAPTSDAEPSEQRAPEPKNVVDPERNEALEAPRPGEEVFKAIFGSDDEDEE